MLYSTVDLITLWSMIQKLIPRKKIISILTTSMDELVIAAKNHITVLKTALKLSLRGLGFSEMGKSRSYLELKQ